MRTRKYWLGSALLGVLLLPTAALASAVSVGEAAIGTAVEERVLVGQGFQFDSSVGKLYAYTRIVGAPSETQISHRWYYGDQLMAEVSLPVRGTDWRTWSTKSMMPQWIGNWRVDVVAEDGSVLDSLNFSIQ